MGFTARIRPGVSFDVQSIVDSEGDLATNIVLATFTCNWGDINAPVLISRLSEKSKLYGIVANSNIIDLILEQGAPVLAVRVGQAGTGTKGTYTVKDTTGAPVSVATLTCKYLGTRDLRFTIRESLYDATKRELLIYDVTTLVETIPFTKGAGGVGEPAALVAAVNLLSEWITATFIADGNKLLALVSGVALTVAGTNPTTATGDYTIALASAEGETFNYVVVDTDTTAVHAVVDAFCETCYNAGHPVVGIVGEPTTVALATRQSDAAAFNDFKMWYVGNGGIDSDLVEYEGWKAAAIVAGITAYRGAAKSNTHYVIPKFANVKGALSVAQIEVCINSGMIVFTKNGSGNVQIEYGITTLITPPTGFDNGWKKGRRTITRFEVIQRSKALLDPLIGQVNNDTSGRSVLMGQIMSVIQEMVNEGKLTSGTVTTDPANPPSGDSVWFLIAIVDVDSAEKIYLTFQFQF